MAWGIRTLCVKLRGLATFAFVGFPTTYHPLLNKSRDTPGKYSTLCEMRRSSGSGLLRKSPKYYWKPELAVGGKGGSHALPGPRLTLARAFFSATAAGLHPTARGSPRSSRRSWGCASTTLRRCRRHAAPTRAAGCRVRRAPTLTLTGAAAAHGVCSCSAAPSSRENLARPLHLDGEMWWNWRLWRRLARAPEAVAARPVIRPASLGASSQPEPSGAP